MKFILFTQEDPFYLVESTKDLISKLRNQRKHQIISSFITPASPFGKKENFVKKTIKTYQIFGFRFFIYYSFRYIIRKIILRKSVSKVLTQAAIPVNFIYDNINSEKYQNQIKKLNADLILIIAGNQIIKSEILNATKYGVFNVHSSLLPNYKGLMPTFWVLKNNENITGVTLYKLTEGIDDGPIIASDEFEIKNKTTQQQLVKALKIKANNLIIEKIDDIKDKSKYKLIKGGSYFNFPNSSDVKEFLANGKKFF